MKKVFVLALAFAGLTSAVKAQKGSILVGGNIDFSSASTPDDGVNPKTTTTTLGFSPTVGYQFSNHLTAGLTADINSRKISPSGSDASTENAWDLGPFIRYTQPVSDIFAFYGQLQGVFGSYKDKVGSTTTAQGNGFGVNLYPAVFINVKNNFGLNFNFGGLSYNSTTPKDGKASGTFDINFGKTVNIGISKNFGGHGK